MKPDWIVKTALITVLVVTIASAQAAQAERYGDGTIDDPFLVPRTSLPVSIDGVLDEAAWQGALILELKYEVSTGENLTPPERTVVMLACGDSCVYVAFRAFDSDISAIRANLNDRDDSWSDDWVAVALDTFNDQQHAYEFYCNPLGAQMDTSETQFSGEDESWDAIWDSAGQIHDWGYAVEMAIPFDQLRFQSAGGEQVWGFDAYRNLPRSHQYQIHIFPLDHNNSCYLCQLVKIKGFAGADPGRSIEITPTVTAVRTDARTEIPGGDFAELNQEAEVGLTAKWGVTANMTLSGALNPDFSQVEADALQLDINQPFALYYSEKRPFFSEGADFFNTPFLAVYTRSMRDPAWGAKLIGKEGSNGIGVYVVRDDITNLIFPGPESSSSTSLPMANTAAVVRYQRDFWNGSSVGVLATDREGSDYHNRLLGVDGRLRLTRSDSITFQFIGTSTRYPDQVAMDNCQPLGDFSDTAFDINYNRNTRNYWFRLRYRDTGELFRADLGFMPSAGTQELNASGGYRWYGETDALIRRIYVSFSADNDTRQDGSLLFRDLHADLTVDVPMMTSFGISLTSQKQAFAGVEFDQFIQNYGFSTEPSGDIFIYCVVGHRDQIDYAHARTGKQFSIRQSFAFKLGRHLQISTDYNMRRLAIEGERLFLTNALDTTITYQFDRRTFVRAIIQFADIRRNRALYAYEVDARSQSLFTQLLFSYKINPRTVLFVGYSDNYFGNQDFSILQTDRTFFVKLGYAWTL